MDTLVEGTKEIVVIELNDRLGTVTALTGINVEQRITTEDESAVEQDWTGVVNTDGMSVECLIDTTGWDEGTYKLYIRVNIPPELPILGPFEFGVS